MGHKSRLFLLENWQSAESWYRWNNILLVYSTFSFFTVYLSKHHPSQHVVASCIHDIQIHLSQAGIALGFANVAIGDFNFIWRQNTALGDFFGDNILFIKNYFVLLSINGAGKKHRLLERASWWQIIKTGNKSITSDC